MLQHTFPAGFIALCLPTKTDKLPSGDLWLHEIKHDGFRVMVRHNARLTDLSVSHATFEAAVAKYLDKRICIWDRACVIRSSYRPRG
jgi:ATP-dependent DNA ligase